MPLFEIQNQELDTITHFCLASATKDASIDLQSGSLHKRDIKEARVCISGPVSLREERRYIQIQSVHFHITDRRRQRGGGKPTMVLGRRAWVRLFILAIRLGSTRLLRKKASPQISAKSLRPIVFILRRKRSLVKGVESSRITPHPRPSPAAIRIVRIAPL